jgi:DUF1365 family protein
MESCFYTGSVRHRRRGDVSHRFAFPVGMLYLDLDELPEVFCGSTLWSADRPAFAWFRRADHLGDPDLPLASCVRDLVATRTGQRPTGPIRLLTHLRYAGYGMNPVSFYYCFDADGERVTALVAEVNNTPWGEQHCYVVDPAGHAVGAVARARTRKSFHVSPFMGMDRGYTWTVRTPGRRLALRITSEPDDGSDVFDAVLVMRRREISSRERARFLARHPLMTLQVPGGFYWQALRLFAKGARFHPPPGRAAPALESRS